MKSIAFYLASVSPDLDGMATAKSEGFYSAIPPEPNYIVLPIYYTPFHRRNRYRTVFFVFLLALAASLFVLWPSDPELKIVRLRLNNVHVRTSPSIALDLSISLTVKVRNADAYRVDYKKLDVAVGYRGKKLGHVKCKHGHVKPWGSSYVDAELELNGIEVLFDVVYLLEDLAKGTIPFDTVTDVKGKLGLYFFHIPLKAKVSCEILVNTTNQTIIHHNCYPE